MDIKVGINDVFNIIPVFDGKPKELSKFIACGDILFSSIKDTDHPTKFDYRGQSSS